jgi:hypothetical protein
VVESSMGKSSLSTMGKDLCLIPSTKVGGGVDTREIPKPSRRKSQGA